VEQARDFLDETNALAALIAGLDEADYATPTQFKQWSIDMVLRHLHVWNRAVRLALTDADAFDAFVKAMAGAIRAGALPDFERQHLKALSGLALREAWLSEAGVVANMFEHADPSARLPWVGPPMSARSAITARLMETWAHGQAVYDVLGQVRQEQDRIGNIVRLGVNTYGWTFRNRKEEEPGPMPRLSLIAPSGALWQYGEGSDSITGSAAEFCQIVTQTRNIADTALIVEGDGAQRWMAIAQCFAGPPADPPPPGFRFRTCK
jgi:uncharacterized protein (TIGR03084 family)